MYLFIFFIMLLISFFSRIIKLIKQFKAYNRVIEERDNIRRYGAVHKGVVIDSEVKVREETIRILYKSYFVKRHYYYATIEFGDFGKKVTFTTPELSDNAKFLNTKEMNVYTLNGEFYATDFGYIERPKRRIKDLFWWMEDEYKENIID